MGDAASMMKRSGGILFEEKENLRVGFSAFQHANLVIPLREGLNREFGPP